MKIVRAAATGIVALAFLSSTGIADESWNNRSVFTEDGIVRFVDDGITPAALASILFPAKAPLTRSIWQESTNVTNDVPVSVAMLIQFEFDSSNLTNESKARLDKIGKMLKMDIVAGKRLVIEGHTDVAGPDAYNERLSYARAESVKRHLTFQHNISIDRLDIDGKGERHLIDPENPFAAVNRRVQFKAS